MSAPAFSSRFAAAFSSSVGSGPSPSIAAVRSGMLVSDVPGYYAEGEFGVRIENLVLVREDQTTVDGEFLRFETVTMCPYDWAAIDESLLTEEEKQQIEEYHDRVYAALTPYLNEEETKWLAKMIRR